MRLPLRAAAAAAAAACLVLPACSASEPAGRPQDGCVLRIASGADVSGGVRERVLDAVWNSRGNRPRACFVVISEVADEQRSEMISAAQAETGHYDVFNLDIQSIPEFAAGGHLLPVDPAAHSVTNDFLAQVWSAGAWERTQYAVPFNTDVGLLYYRDDILPGPPAGWPEMFALAERHRSALSSPALPFAGQFAPYEGLTVNVLEALWANGGDVVDPAGGVVIDTERGRTAVQRLVDAVRAGVVSGDARNGFEAQSLTAFRDRQALFLRHWPSAYEVLSGERQEGGVGFAAAPLPWPGVLGGQYLAVSADTGRPGEAQRLVAALTGPEAAAMLYHCGGFAPARVSALYARARCGDSAPAGSEPRSQVAPPETLLRALAGARVRPPSPYYNRFSQVLRSEVHALLTCWSLRPSGCESVEDFTAGLAPRLEEALAGH
ncbi:extracellular solute-binding protein [Planomonospora venezuelensis]|uniref:Multiple sugar transport system substrate-binding protein n=1 Tax=Planomonospora venezuelensis TaxID=1999 RepID=A0A841D7F1_PLAVE|nr:multiple sugar transport system substrate-binding protein [Planomonospora venezuelensis]GIN01982.1 ABC transporter substrate-binding protein [Planomonospora venezuelensis]